MPSKKENQKLNENEKLKEKNKNENEYEYENENENEDDDETMDQNEIIKGLNDNWGEIIID